MAVLPACLQCVKQVSCLYFHCRLPSLCTWRRASVVIKLQCRRDKKTYAWQCESEKSVFLLDWDRTFCPKRTERPCLAISNGRSVKLSHIVMLLALIVYISGLFRIFWLTNMTFPIAAVHVNTLFIILIRACFAWKCTHCVSVIVFQCAAKCQLTFLVCDLVKVTIFLIWTWMAFWWLSYNVRSNLSKVSSTQPFAFLSRSFKAYCTVLLNNIARICRETALHQLWYS